MALLAVCSGEVYKKNQTSFNESVICEYCLGLSKDNLLSLFHLLIQLTKDWREVWTKEDMLSMIIWSVSPPWYFLRFPPLEILGYMTVNNLGPSKHSLQYSNVVSAKPLDSSYLPPTPPSTTTTTPPPFLYCSCLWVHQVSSSHKLWLCLPQVIISWDCSIISLTFESLVMGQWLCMFFFLVSFNTLAVYAYCSMCVLPVIIIRHSQWPYRLNNMEVRTQFHFIKPYW